VTTHPSARSKATRYIELENMLKERSLELSNEVKDRKRDARTDNAKDLAVLDEGESSEADTQEEIEFALIQMKAEMLSQITTALHRLRDGSYGSCMECANDIPETRLRVVPFAVRCKKCEEACESAERWVCIVAQRQSSAGSFDMSR
jgi:DnaK suppressor protein